MDEHHAIQWRRNQMESALWWHFATVRHWGVDTDKIANRVPQRFKSRIKKMLNLDRSVEKLKFENVPNNQWAFFDGPGKSSGSEELYSAVHVFIMGITLILLDVGLKQAEVIYFLKHTRPILQNAFDQIHNRTGSISPIVDTGRQHHSYKHYLDSSEPVQLKENGAKFADFSAWMIFQRFEYSEIFPQLNQKRTRKTEMLIFEPQFVFGVEEIKKKLFNDINSYQSLILIEIAEAALKIPSYLKNFDPKGRGRPARS